MLWGYVFLFLVFAGIVAAVYWQQYGKNQNSNPQPAQEQKDEMADWKTYTNTEYGFEFKYPSNYTVEQEKMTDKWVNVYLIDGKDKLTFEINKERITSRIKEGAQVSSPVWNLLVRAGIVEGPKRPVHAIAAKKDVPGAQSAESQQEETAVATAVDENPRESAAVSVEESDKDA